ncbi:MAG: sugar phosphate isomerase/epimerase [Gaiellales bacterium]
MSAALPGLSFDDLAEWTTANGYEMLEVACWPSADGAGRRYAGVCHLDVERLDPDHVQTVLERTGLEISSLAYYPNNLHPDPETREAMHGHLRKVIDAAVVLNVPMVGTFVGRDPWRTLPENLDEFRRVWPALLDYAGERGITIAIENCPMIFTWDEWPGGLNLASTPAAWDEMFSSYDAPHFGLNLDPSHLHWQLIDPEQVVRDYAPRIRHVHAKDMEIDKAGLQRHGVLSAGMGWQVPRLPGLGEINWGRFIGQLYRVGYDGVISVEHEDRAFEGTEALVKRGFEIARDALRPYIH